MAAYQREMDHADWPMPDIGEEPFRPTAAGQYLTAARQAEAEYFEDAPRVALSCCPFDGKPLLRSFDPFGLDGLWWRTGATPEEPPSCRHFCVLLGALDFAGNVPQAGDFEVHPGPGRPFVIPRLLDHPSMLAVISQFRMENGYLAYPIAYFAERRPPP